MLRYSYLKKPLKQYQDKENPIIYKHDKCSQAPGN